MRSWSLSVRFPFPGLIYFVFVRDSDESPADKKMLKRGPLLKASFHVRLKKSDLSIWCDFKVDSELGQPSFPGMVRPVD